MQIVDAVRRSILRFYALYVIECAKGVMEG